MSERDVKGIWIPIEIWEDEDLTPFEVLLLAEIDSFDTGQGCFKKDETLADRMRCSVSHLSNTLSSLRKRDYISSSSNGPHQRVLRTCFSRHTGLRQTVGRVTVKSNERLRPTVRHRDNNGENRENSDQQAAHRGLLPPDQAQYDKFIIKSCDKLENFVRTKHRFDPKHHSKTRWYEQMRLLLQDIKGDRERLVRVLGTYIEEEHTDYTPVADSARSFRKKFISIERWANKIKPEDNRSQYREIIV